MLIKVKNKDTLIFDDFIFVAQLEKKEFLGNKKEGDFKLQKDCLSLVLFIIELIELKILKQNLNLKKINKKYGLVQRPNR